MSAENIVDEADLRGVRVIFVGFAVTDRATW